MQKLGIACLVVIVAVRLVMWGCGGGKARVTRQQFGEQWPLTVESGYLSCEVRSVAGRRLQAVVFHAPDGRRYAVNGFARQWGLGEAIEPIWALDPGWQAHLAWMHRTNHPDYRACLAQTPLRKDIGPLIERGLALDR